MPGRIEICFIESSRDNLDCCYSALFVEGVLVRDSRSVAHDIMRHLAHDLAYNLGSELNVCRLEDIQPVDDPAFDPYRVLAEAHATGFNPVAIGGRWEDSLTWTEKDVIAMLRSYDVEATPEAVAFVRSRLWSRMERLKELELHGIIMDSISDGELRVPAEAA